MTGRRKNEIWGQTPFIISERITEDEKSLPTLLPFKEKLKSTDWLIDKLVRTD